MQPGEIYLAQFPFGDAPAMKLRPVLLLTGPVGRGPEVPVAYISSVVPPKALDSDLMVDPTLPEHYPSHLKAVSVLRLHKLATIHARSVARRLGELSPLTKRVVSQKLESLLRL